MLLLTNFNKSFPLSGRITALSLSCPFCILEATVVKFFTTALFTSDIVYFICITAVKPLAYITKMSLGDTVSSDSLDFL